MTPPIIVAGLGRCGTSLVMQMLHAGGVPCVGQYPAFEEHDVDLSRCGGMAVKVLDMPRFKPRIPTDALIIRLTRDTHQQALSQAKMMRLTMGIPINRQQLRAVEASLDRDEGKTSTMIGWRKTRSLTFEYLLAKPRDAAAEIARFIDRQFDVELAAAQVRQRPSDCAPGLDMELKLIEESTR